MRWVWLGVTLCAVCGCNEATGISDRKPIDKAQLAPTLSRYADRDANTVFLKFVEGSDMRLSGGMFITEALDHRPGARSVTAAVDAIGATVTRTFGHRTVAEIDAERAALLEKGIRVADLNLHYKLLLPPGSDLQAIADQLNGYSAVEIAWVKLKRYAAGNVQ